MNNSKFLKTDSLIPFLGRLSEKGNVLVPVKEKNAVVFRPYGKHYAPYLDGMPTFSAKEVTFPRSEPLMFFRETRDHENPGQTKLELKENLPEAKVIVFGDRPCGPRGKKIFDRVYDTEGVKDPYYVRRRENTLYITLACATPENTCFCHSVGGGPADTAGSDLLLTPVSGGFVAQPITPAGEALLFPDLFTDAGEKGAEADAVHQKALEKLGAPEDFTPARQKLIARFEDASFWEEMSAKCIGCGGCTYLCPTCYCFNITDEGAGSIGKRVRSWDTCMQSQFTLEASGHNPRAVKANRLKNRMGHKFSYYPELHEGLIACCGCGRCIKSCPVSVDIRAVIRAAQGE